MACESSAEKTLSENCATSRNAHSYVRSGNLITLKCWSGFDSSVDTTTMKYEIPSGCTFNSLGDKNVTCNNHDGVTHTILNPQLSWCSGGGLCKFNGSETYNVHMQVLTYPVITCPDVMPCSTPVPVNAPKCEGGKGLSMTGNEMQIGQKLLEMFGLSLPHFTQTPTPPSSINVANETSTRQDGSECSFADNNVSSDVYDYIICPLGAKSSSSSSEKSSSSSSKESSSSFSSSSEESSSSSSSFSEKSSSSSDSDESSSSSSEEEPSSSSWGASSSSSGYGGGETAPCAISMRTLQKSVADDYDDGWVYLGKQAYKTVSERQYFPTYQDKYFDVSGRVYSSNKLRDKYYYYIDGNKVYKPRTVETYLEFDVWKRVIKDEDGNDVKMFIKEDKKRGIRRDSSFYYGGYWEVFEQEEISGTARLRASDGTISWSKYDNKNRLTESYLVNGKGDTLISERYEWKGSKLAKTIIEGVKRVYVYGKTLQDTVKVIPSDDWIKDYYNSGYNGTAGKMPEEGTSEYEVFARGPYRYRYEENSNINFAAKNSADSLNILKKTYTNNCVDEEIDMPVTVCLRDEYNDIINPDSTLTKTQGKYGWPGNGYTLAYGSSDIQFLPNFDCFCNLSGKYQVYFNGYTSYEIIFINQSTWKYNQEREFWYEFCWYKPDLNKTYKHETQHIKNGRKARDEMIKFTSTYNNYNTVKECDEQANKELNWLEDRWNEWYKREYEHKNPNSPNKYGGYRHDGYFCY